MGGDAAERRRVAALAGHAGDEPAARVALDDGDPGVRATALGALERIGTLQPADLVRALDDPSVVVRRRACEAAARWPGDGPPSLLGALRDDDATLAEVAAWASGEREPPEPGAMEVVIVLATDHADALVREAAVAALGAMGDPTALPAILAALEDKATVRRRAVLALAPFEGEAVDAALARARTDRDWQVRQAAEDLSD
ncbi:MAG: HEAT repeat domain-containing protein [Acidimicrobiales bacterium]